MLNTIKTSLSTNFAEILLFYFILEDEKQDDIGHYVSTKDNSPQIKVEC